MNAQMQTASVSHAEATRAELRNDPEFIAEYLRAALAELDQPEYREIGILALRDIADALTDA